MLATGFTTAGRTAAIAAPLVNTLAASLRAIAAIGVVTVGINYIDTRVKTALDVAALQRREASGGAARVFAGASRETVLQAQAQQRAERKRQDARNAQLLKDLEKIKPLAGSGIATPLAMPEMQRITEQQTRLGYERRFTNAVLGLDPNRFRRVAGVTPPPPGLPPGTTGGGGAGSGKAKADDKAQQQQAIAAAQAQLSEAKALFNVENQIFKARADGNRQQEIILQGQADALKIAYEVQALQRDTEMSAAAKKAKMGQLEVDAAKIARQAVFDITQLEKERTDAAAGAMQQLQDELDLQQAKINGNEAEVILNQQIRDLKAQYPALNEADIRTTLQKTNALKQQISAAEQLKQLYADVGMSIKSGVVDAIQGAIDGTKSLQQVAVDLLNSIANKLLDIAVNMALFGTMSGTGTGGGLLGGLFRANGGSVASGQPYIVGERGPELFMPGRSGTIIPNHNLGGGGISVVVNVDASGSSVTGDQTQGKQLGLAVSAAVQAELLKQKRPGGLLA